MNSYNPVKPSLEYKSFKYSPFSTLLTVPLTLYPLLRACCPQWAAKKPEAPVKRTKKKSKGKKKSNQI